jgi:diguanylate cyclase (GGDEF)-like protein
MLLDVSSISLASALVALGCALPLFLYWAQERSAWAALWWGGASCGKGIGVVLLTFHAALPLPVSQGLAPLILNLSALFAWVAARIFVRGRVRAWPILLGYAGWTLIMVVIGANARQQIVDTFGCSSTAGLYLAAAICFMRSGERLRARGPMVAVLVLQSVALFMFAAEIFNSELARPLPLLDALGIVPFADLVGAMGVTSCLIIMLKERSDAALRSAALTDSLTGLANRRAFMERAQRMLDRSRRDDTPLCLLAFDLDHFKKINDGFGHATGDEVLRIFADTVLRVLRSTDLAARLGGEEFVAALPGCSAKGAFATAERIRGAFQDNARFLRGAPLGATVSVGVVIAEGGDAGVAALIEEADAALYRAKALGRNRVVSAGAATAGEQDSEASLSNVIPVVFSRRAG